MNVRSLPLLLGVAAALGAFGAQADPAADAPLAGAPAAPLPSLDFDLLDPPTAPMAPKPNPAFESSVRTRRTMLELHQALGFATWAAVATTVVLGQLQLHDRYGGGGDTGKFRIPHLAFAIGSSTLFAGTGLLAAFAPSPFERREGLSTALLHKVMMYIATAGMAAQIILGIVTGLREGALDQRAFAATHQAVGYVTAGALTVGAVTLFF